MTKSSISQSVHEYNTKLSKDTQFSKDTRLSQNIIPSEKKLNIQDGWFSNNSERVEHFRSPHFSPREVNSSISLLVVHNISLPPKQFGGPFITDFFMGKLDKNADPYFETIHEMKVSAHCLIKRDGTLIQYVSFLDKAWHAGVSTYKGKEKCNDFSIGIELEGADDILYTEHQYQTLALARVSIEQEYLEVKGNVAGHNEIAPGRKTDPGEAFDWHYFECCSKNIQN